MKCLIFNVLLLLTFSTNTKAASFDCSANLNITEKAICSNTALNLLDEQLSKYEKDKAEVLAKNEEIADKNCQAAKLNEKMLNSFDKVMITDANGKNRALSDKEKKAQLALSKEHISLYCNKNNTQKD